MAPFLPGTTLGILGGGQLGRFLAIQARLWGYKVVIWSSGNEAPAAEVADFWLDKALDDPGALELFCHLVDVATCEFENLPLKMLQAIEAEGIALHPGSNAIAIAQHRFIEKQTLRSLGLPVTPFASIEQLSDCESAWQELAQPDFADTTCFLKTAMMGYDGKGQRLVGSLAELRKAWQELGAVPCVLEAKVTFQQELSLLVARNGQGAIACYPLIENHHYQQILDVSIAPAPDWTEALQQQAEVIATKLLEHLNYIGLLCIEFFLTDDGRLVINELAPRPHNSGHLTLEACQCTQFEQQLRAVCGYPLGDAQLRVSQAMMVNLLGDCWPAEALENKALQPNEKLPQPDWSGVLSETNLSLHLYGKSQPKQGRKMGHLTLLNQELLAREALLAKANALKQRLSALEVARDPAQ